MKELPKKLPGDVSGGFGTLPCTDPPYIPGKTPVIDEPFPPYLPSPIGEPNPTTI